MHGYHSVASPFNSISTSSVTATTMAPSSMGLLRKQHHSSNLNLNTNLNLSSNTSVISIPHRSFAKRRKRRIKPPKRKKPDEKKVMKMRWTFAKYMLEKENNPNISYADEESAQWGIFSAMIVERTARLHQYDTSWEVEMENLRDEYSFKADKKIPNEWVVDPKVKAEDDERSFEPNPRVTDEDYSGEKNTLHRRLDRSVYLLVKVPVQVGDKMEERWTFPTGEWEASETIRETAERTVTQLLHPNFDTHLLGNHPIMHTCDEDAKTKVFYLHNVWLGGQTLPPEAQQSPVTDHAWVTKNEFEEYLGYNEPLMQQLRKVFYNP